MAKKYLYSSYKENKSFDGQEKTLKEWSKVLGIEQQTLYKRIKRGLPLEPKLNKLPLFKYKGEEKSLKEWSKELKIPYHTLLMRIKKGISINKVFMTKEEKAEFKEKNKIEEIKNKIKKNNKKEIEKLKIKLGPCQKFEYDGQIKTVRQWAITKGIDYQTLRQRLKNGWGIKRSLEKPVRKKNLLTALATTETCNGTDPRDQFSVLTMAQSPKQSPHSAPR